jgi:hypothetical protein
MNRKTLALTASGVFSLQTYIQSAFRVLVYTAYFFSGTQVVLALS